MDCVELMKLATEVAERVQAEIGLGPSEVTVDYETSPFKPPIKLVWHLDYRGDGLGVTGMLDAILSSRDYQGVGAPRVDHTEQEYRWVGTVATDIIEATVYVHGDLTREVGDE